MAEQKTIVGAIAGYFNQGDGKRPLTKFQEELKALTDEEKLELVQGACSIMGWELKTK